MGNWYKKNIDRREWDTYYSKIHAYQRIDEQDGSLWVAVKLAEETGSEMPAYLIKCTIEETNRLDARA